MPHSPDTTPSAIITTNQIQKEQNCVLPLKKLNLCKFLNFEKAVADQVVNLRRKIDEYFLETVDMKSSTQIRKILHKLVFSFYKYVNKQKYEMYEVNIGQLFSFLQVSALLVPYLAVTNPLLADNLYIVSIKY